MEIVLSELVYDELGRVSKKNLLADKSASNSALQSITYSYNIRNWLKGIASSGFTENLFYNDPPSGTGLYNGNISRMNWNSYYGGSRSYLFTYDGLNRMTKAAYSPYELFNEELTYDKMGNITTLKRFGSLSSKTMIDSLTLTYNGNQLKTVTEAATGSIYGFVKPGSSTIEYSYNKNGAMKYDLNGGIAYIQYNWLNLPEKISFAKGHMTTYNYDASGQKRQVTHITVQNELAVAMGNANYQVNSNNVRSWLTTDYCGNGHIVYEDHALKMVLTPEGYLTKSGNNYVYNFYLKDHLGNNREVLKWFGAMPYSSNWTLAQENEYYPFGMPYPTAGYYPEAQPYKFGGKEMDEMNGLKWYDFEARQKGTVLPPFTTRDPLAEKYYNISPYAYCGNNPVNRIDPDGRDWYSDEEGNRMWRRSQDKAYTDDNGKTWSNIGEEYMLFDGRNLTYFQQGKNKDGKLTLKVNSYEAVSGKSNEDGSFSYSDESQATKGGPIPEGEYAVWAQDIQKYDDLSTWDKFKSNFGGSAFPGGTDSWGDERTWIYPKSVSVTNPITGEVVERTNMSIHGGITPGSRGCIDLTVNAPRFFNNLRHSTSKRAIYLDVRYPTVIKR